MIEQRQRQSRILWRSEMQRQGATVKKKKDVALGNASNVGADKADDWEADGESDEVGI